MNNRQWLSIYEFNSSQRFLEETDPLLRAVPKAQVKLAVRSPVAIFPRPLRPAF